MDFSKGYLASFYCCLVDPTTWTDGDVNGILNGPNRIEIVDGNISRAQEDIRQNATITVKDIDNLADSWIRIYMEADQNGDSVKIPLFTGLASSPSTRYSKGVMTYSLNCYSVLKSISDIVLPIGWYAPAGVNGVEQIRKLLSTGNLNVVVPTNIDYSRMILGSTLIAENDETNLTMIDAILHAMDWMLQIGGDGTIYLSPIPYPDTDDPVATLSRNNDVLESDFSVSDDWFDCPNVLRVTYGDLTAIAKDEDPNSMFSIQNRGREIWATDDSVTLLNGQNLTRYARDKLKEEQNRTVSVSYTRRFLPEVNQGDYIKVDYNELRGNFYVDNQSITLGPCAKTNETIFSYN